MACHIKDLPHKIQTRVLHQLLLQKKPCFSALLVNLLSFSFKFVAFYVILLTFYRQKQTTADFDPPDSPGVFMVNLWLN